MYGPCFFRIPIPRQKCYLLSSLIVTWLLDYSNFHFCCLSFSEFCPSIISYKDANSIVNTNNSARNSRCYLREQLLFIMICSYLTLLNWVFCRNSKSNVFGHFSFCFTAIHFLHVNIVFAYYLRLSSTCFACESS